MVHVKVFFLLNEDEWFMKKSDKLTEISTDVEEDVSGH